MPYLKTDSGINWYYDVEGEGEKILFIHGWGVDRRIWRQQYKYFSKFYRVLSVDLPGHGKSEWKKFPLETMVRDLAQILSKENFDKVSVMGSSLGGLVALKVYQIHPEMVQKMILVGSMPKFSRSEDYPHGLDTQKMRKLSGQLNSNYPAIVHIFFRSLFTKQERQTRRFLWIQKFRRTEAVPFREALAEYLDVLEQEDLREVLRGVSVPLQIINGRDDEICSEETVEYMRTIVPAACIHYFEECGHFPFLSKPYEFNMLVENFLKQ